MIVIEPFMRRLPLKIMLAEDDEDDYLIIRDAFQEASIMSENTLERVKDGQELMDSLLRETTCPSIIIMDLNMPKKDGRMALKEIRSCPELRQIPVVVLTTSNASNDIIQTYGLGISGFIRKPAQFDEFVGVATKLKHWLEIIEFPNCP